MKKNYTQTVHYQIEVTSKYMKLAGIQLIKKIGVDLSFDEFIALDMLASEGPMCQRDLAKIILKDRANTGRVANSLEKKGYIVIDICKKNNRLIKKMVLTKKGEETIKNIVEKIKPIVKPFEEKFGKEHDMLIEMLKKHQEIIKNILEIHI